MLRTFKLWKLTAALDRPGNSEEAYTAVLALGRMGHAKALEALIKALSRGDGVSRSAARELGRLGDERAVPALVSLLENEHVGRSAMEALIRIGSAAVDGLVQGLKSERASARQLAAKALGDIREPRAVQPLIEVLAHDEDYGVRTAAAAALGHLKDSRAVWALVATLKLRDEITPERLEALRELQRTAEVAMRKLGDPLANRAGGSLAAATDQAMETMEQTIKDTGEMHPRLMGDLALLSESELVSVLRELIGASEEISWAKLEDREPLLIPCFRTYEQRCQAAEVIGRELHRRGGAALVKKVLGRDLQNYAAIKNWWSALLD